MNRCTGAVVAGRAAALLLAVVLTGCAAPEPKEPAASPAASSDTTGASPATLSPEDEARVESCKRWLREVRQWCRTTSGEPRLQPSFQCLQARMMLDRECLGH